MASFRLGGFRLLAGTWAAIAAASAATAGVLAVLGPPAHGGARQAGRAVAAASPVAHAPPVRLAAETSSPAPAKPPAADPALLEPAPDVPGRNLPVVGADGRRPAAAYAAPSPRVLPGEARLALVVDGVGLDGAVADAAIAELPPGVTLALSPYGGNLDALAAAARARGHEVLASIPMEPEGSPLTDEGEHAIRPDAAPADNARNLEWALAASSQYAGVTGAEAGQTGAHVANEPDTLRIVTAEAAARGLFYLEPNPGHALAGGVAGLVADVDIRTDRDGEATRADLERLAATAIRTGHAVGVAGLLSAPTLERLLAWARTLPARGVVLVPTSSLVRPAETAEAALAP